MFASLQLPSPKVPGLDAHSLTTNPVLPVSFGYFQRTVLLTVYAELYFFNHLLSCTLVCSTLIPLLRLRGNTSTILTLSEWEGEGPDMQPKIYLHSYSECLPSTTLSDPLSDQLKAEASFLTVKCFSPGNVFSY